MSFRYPNGSFIKPGLNTLASPPTQITTYLYSWGFNNAGQLGLNDTTQRSSPTQVGSLTDWSDISLSRALGRNTIAIKTNGTLWGWGQNQFGQLGLGNTTSYSSPKQIGSLTNWSKVSAGDGFTVAIKTDGTLWSWGRNDQGNLGLGNATYYSSPKQVGSLTNWLSVSSSYHSLAIKTDGTLWAWGLNIAGQLGFSATVGTYTGVSSPTQVGALTNWSAVSAGDRHSLAVKTDGTLWTWGNNDEGQLGLNNRTSYSSPKQVGSLTNWLQVSAGQPKSAMSVKTNGTLWSWGLNDNGQLGLGNRTNYSSPKQVGSLTNWLRVSAGSYFTAATKTDGTLWSWGRNNTGQLGLGNTTPYSSPKQVGSLTNWLQASAGYSFTFGRLI